MIHWHTGRENLLWLSVLLLWVSLASAQTVIAANENPALVPLEYRQPGFWIGRHPAPDSLLAQWDALSAFNRHCVDTGYNYDFELFTQAGGVESARLPMLRAREKKQIQDLLDYTKTQCKYNAAGEKLKPEFWEGIAANMQLDSFDAGSEPQYAFALRFTNQRLVPYADALLEGANDREFDQVQNSGIDLGEALIIFHGSQDGKWLYGRGRSSGGWYLKSDLFIVPQPRFQRHLHAEDFIITTEDKSDIYLDATAKRYYSFTRMGTRLPLLGEYGDYYVVELPDAKAGYISINQAHRGYLPYTARNVYLQAFKILNAPYGWGDLNGEYDCSGYLKALFQCFGIYLPRNGAAQAAVGNTLLSFTANSTEREAAIIQRGVPAATLLRMPGHIMLYLGSVAGRAYTIHSVYGYRIPSKDKDIVVKVNKCIVSDLDLGKGSARKSLLERLAGIYQIP